MNARQRNQAKLQKKRAGMDPSTSGGRYTPPARARTRAAIVSTGLVLLVLNPAAPALAAEPAGGVTWAPAEGEHGTQEEARLAGTVELAARVATDQPVDGWSLAVLDEAGQPAFGTVCDKKFRRPRDDFTMQCRWDTTRAADQRPSANRRYVVRLSTLQDRTLTPVGPDRTVGVANPAAAPADVTLTYDSSAQKVRLAWTANAEPDIHHYAVEENVDDRGWLRVATPTGTTSEHTVSDTGDHRYRVAAERPGPDGQPLGPGAWASPEQGSGRSRADRDRRGASRSESPGADRPAAEDRTERRNRRTDAGERTERRNRRTGNGTGDATKRDEAATGDATERSDPGTTDRTPHSSGPVTDRRGDGTPDEARRSEPGAGTSGPSPKNGRAGSSADQRSTPAGPAAPPPADRSPVMFPASSSAGFAALRAPAPAAPRPAPTVPPKPAPAPDPGFQARLPYPAAPAGTGPETLAGAASDPLAGSDAAPTADPAAAADPAAPVVPGTPARANDRRPQGAGLLVVAGGLLATAIRPGARRRPRRKDRTTPAAATPLSAAPPAMDAVAWPAPQTALAPADPPKQGDTDTEMAPLLERIARLEALLDAAHSAPAPVDSSDIGEMNWYAELF